MPKYKASLHIHATEDSQEDFRIKYSVYELIDKAYKYGFKVLALTFHNQFYTNKKYFDYAQKRGILLISGIEKALYNNHKKTSTSHVIILNCNQQAEKLETFTDLREYKHNYPQIFTMIAHPFLPLFSLPEKVLLKNLDIFDALEHTWLYNNLMPYNKKTLEIGKKYNKPVIATGDLHSLKHLDDDYTVISSSELTVESVINSLKQGKFKNVSKGKSLLNLLHSFFVTHF
ncbi:MAG: PHP domain-containing protein [Candidatus Pacebacteria bacterium]|nr:PHP domain-containing protein [Candidatus Paceibacterota bacterium]